MSAGHGHTAIEEAFFDSLADDPRFQSGVPAGERWDDLEFIQMTGLTRPAPPAGVLEADAGQPLPSAGPGGEDPFDGFQHAVARIGIHVEAASAADFEAIAEELRTPSPPETAAGVQADTVEVQDNEGPPLPHAHLEPLAEAEQLLQALERPEDDAPLLSPRPPIDEAPAP